MKLVPALLVFAFWLLVTLVNYYLSSFFIRPIVWIFIVSALLVCLILVSSKLIRDPEKRTGRNIAVLLISGVLWFFSVYHQPVDTLIEFADRQVFYAKRKMIIEQVRRGELNPNIDYNRNLCQLPYNFPVVSNDENQIEIFRNGKTNKLTVSFWVRRNFFANPSVHLVYTDDPEEMENLNELVEQNPDQNWKLEECWYRTCHK